MWASFLDIKTPENTVIPRLYFEELDFQTLAIVETFPQPELELTNRFRKIQYLKDCWTILSLSRAKDITETKIICNRLKNIFRDLNGFALKNFRETKKIFWSFTS